MQTSSIQTLYYTNRIPLEVEDVADSLLAFKALIERTPDLLIRLFPTISIQSVSLTVERVAAGSLLEDLAVKFIWGNQERLDADIESARQTLQIQELIKNPVFLSTLIFSLIAAGSLYVLNKSNATEPQKAPVVAMQNNILLIGSQISGINQQVIGSAAEAVVQANPQLARDAIRAVAPAKREEGATVSAGKDSEVTVSAEAVRAIPTVVQNEEVVESIEDLFNVEVQIRATDLDSTRRGWAAVVPALGDRRIKVHLDIGVQPGKLTAKPAVRADLTVVFKRDGAGEKVPVLIYIRKVRR